MPRPRIHAHLTIEAIEKEIAKHFRAGADLYPRALINTFRALKVPISETRIKEYAAQESLPFEVSNDNTESKSIH